MLHHRVQRLDVSGHLMGYGTGFGAGYTALADWRLRRERDHLWIQS